MKKVFLVAIALIVLFIAGIFVLTSTKLNIGEEISIDASDVSASKFLINKNGWDRWWPGKKIGDNHYQYQDSHFYITQITNSDVYLKLQKGNLVLNADISYLAGEEGAVNIKWIAGGEGKSGIFSRVQNYLDTKATSREIAEILVSLKRFLQDEKNVYGYKIYLNHTKDPILLATSGTYAVAPTMAFVYEIIDNLKEQARKKGAVPTNFPMLNITQTDEQQYELNVALPINKQIEPTVANTKIKQYPKGS